MKKIKQLLLLLSFIGFTSLYATEYRVDTKASKVTFKIHHAFVAIIKGKFDEFSGSYNYDEKSSTFSSFVGEANTATVNTDDIYRDKHLKEKVFNVEKYPQMKMELIRQDGNSFLTKLTIKGITKEIPMTISLVPDRKNTFQLLGEIKRTDFDLNFSDTSKIGEMSVGEDISINILFTGE